MTFKRTVTCTAGCWSLTFEGDHDSQDTATWMGSVRLPAGSVQPDGSCGECGAPVERSTGGDA